MSSSNSDFSRRKFVASSLSCLAAAGLASVSPLKALAQSEEPGSEKPSNEVPVRTLGRTGLKLPIISMGAGACNDPGLVQACFESGMRHFDTAANYGFGRNEQMVGRAIKKMGVRKEAIIATKAHTPAQRGGLTPEQSKKRLIESLEASLKRLKTDYVDILYVHDVRSPEVVSDEAIVESLKQLKKDGKVRYLGISTHSDMANVVNATVAADIYDVILTSINFTMVDDTDLLAAIANASTKGLGVVAMKTQAGGARFPNPDSLRDHDSAVINSAALKWALRNEHITTAITGISTYDHMRANMTTARNLEYTKEEKAFLGDNRITLGMGFCRQCRRCLATCPKGVEIPDLMRTHMYASQYGDFRLARETLDSVPAAAGLTSCTSCDGCIAACANTVDIPGKIADLKLIYA